MSLSTLTCSLKLDKQIAMPHFIPLFHFLNDMRYQSGKCIATSFGFCADLVRPVNQTLWTGVSGKGWVPQSLHTSSGMRKCGFQWFSSGVNWFLTNADD